MPIREIADRHACARRGERLAIATGCPFRRAHAECIEQVFAREFMQRFARALGDKARQQSGRAAAVGPVRAGHIDNAPLQNVAIAIRRIVHRGLAVARIGTEQAALVPVRAHGHRQHMLDREPIAAFFVGEVAYSGNAEKSGASGGGTFPCCRAMP